MARHHTSSSRSRCSRARIGVAWSPKARLELTWSSASTRMRPRERPRRVPSGSLIGNDHQRSFFSWPPPGCQPHRSLMAFPQPPLPLPRWPRCAQQPGERVPDELPLLIAGRRVVACVQCEPQQRRPVVLLTPLDELCAGHATLGEPPALCLAQQWTHLLEKVRQESLWALLPGALSRHHPPAQGPDPRMMHYPKPDADRGWRPVCLQASDLHDSSPVRPAAPSHGFFPGPCFFCLFCSFLNLLPWPSQ